MAGGCGVKGLRVGIVGFLESRVEGIFRVEGGAYGNVC